MFITFEGIDGSGKTTQSQLLAKYFRQLYGEGNVILTREPGGTDFAEKLRKELLISDVDPVSELLLLISMRYEHMKKLISTALQEGKIVICDRFIDSTIAYQGYGFGVDLELIKKLHTLVEISYPNMTFILDIDIGVGLSRAEHKSKYEKMDENFFHKVRYGFQEIAKKDLFRCQIISEVETQDCEKISSIIIAKALERIPKF